MHMKDSLVPKSHIRSFKIQQIYVHNLPNISEYDQVQLEKDLINYFAMFGKVVEQKVLRNGLLMREKASLCLNYFPRRNLCTGNSIKSSQIV